MIGLTTPIPSGRPTVMQPDGHSWADNDIPGCEWVGRHTCNLILANGPAMILLITNWWADNGICMEAHNLLFIIYSEHMDDNAVDEAWSLKELGLGNNAVGV
jgi:hypothetical protein